MSRCFHETLYVSLHWNWKSLESFVWRNTLFPITVALAIYIRRVLSSCLLKQFARQTMLPADEVADKRLTESTRRSWRNDVVVRSWLRLVAPIDQNRARSVTYLLWRWMQSVTYNFDAEHSAFFEFVLLKARKLKYVPLFSVSVNANNRRVATTFRRVWELYYSRRPDAVKDAVESQNDDCFCL